MGRHKSWRFRSLLTITPDLARCIDNIHRSEDALKRILSSQILNGSRPDHLVNVEVRFARTDLNHGCSELPFEATFSQKYSWRNTLCIDGSAQRGVQSAAIAIAQTRTGPFGHPIPIISVRFRLSLYGEAALNKGGYVYTAFSKNDHFF
jgi:hypothetical protein